MPPRKLPKAKSPLSKLFRNFRNRILEKESRRSQWRIFSLEIAHDFAARLRLPMCSRSGRLRRGRPLRIRSDRLPLSDMASRACSKPVGAMYARGAGPSTPSLDQRERVGHYREQAVASPRLHSRRWYQRVIGASKSGMFPFRELEYEF